MTRRFTPTRSSRSSRSLLSDRYDSAPSRSVNVACIRSTTSSASSSSIVSGGVIRVWSPYWPSTWPPPG
ncbi:hypothetical protein D8S78_07470 [Natrialba swarupiae]|nr:hypothetical protein [Natrialba swarupiae]